jgi:hypothetical protein
VWNKVFTKKRARTNRLRFIDYKEKKSEIQFSARWHPTNVGCH